jgi:hypothetical protein
MCETRLTTARGIERRGELDGLEASAVENKISEMFQ